MKSDLDTWYSEWLQEKNSTIALSTKMQVLEALPLRVQTLECQAKAQSSQLSEVFQTVQNLLAQDRHQGPVSSPQYLELLDQIKVLNNKVETLQMEVRVLSCNPPSHNVDPQLSSQLHELKAQVNHLLVRQQEPLPKATISYEAPQRAPSATMIPRHWNKDPCDGDRDEKGELWGLEAKRQNNKLGGR